jgi:hypothetical protein
MADPILFVPVTLHQTIETFYHAFGRILAHGYFEVHSDCKEIA